MQVSCVRVPARSKRNLTYVKLIWTLCDSDKLTDGDWALGKVTETDGGWDLGKVTDGDWDLGKVTDGDWDLGKLTWWWLKLMETYEMGLRLMETNGQETDWDWWRLS